jgi:hypothetical protein
MREISVLLWKIMEDQHIAIWEFPMLFATMPFIPIGKSSSDNYWSGVIIL